MAHSNQYPAKLLTLLAKNRGILLIVLLIFVFRSVLADHYHVPSGSMKPAIHIGDRIFVNKIAYQLRLPFTNLSLLNLNAPQRGDIIVFEHPKKEIMMVKRLIAVPGDQVEINNGFVIVNGKELLTSKKPFKVNSPLAYYTEETSTRRYQIQRMINTIANGHSKFTVPHDSYFFMGDNRDNSSDSRSWGFVPRKLIRGKALFVTFSINGLTPDWNRFGSSLYH